MEFDHERLDVYRVALDFASWAYEMCKNLNGADRNARDQLVRASLSIPLNIAEGNGKRSMRDRRRFFEIARGSALECAAILDTLLVCQVLGRDHTKQGKRLLLRIVAMLTKMTEVGGLVREPGAEYERIDYEHEHRFAEHEHDNDHDRLS